MAFTPKTWQERIVQYPGRIILTRTGNTDEYDPTRSEGTITQAGDLISASNLNSLEQRILDAINATADGTSGDANNALALGGVPAANFPQISSDTWTPTILGYTSPGSPVYSAQSGSYYKIGKLVVTEGAIEITSKGGMTGIVCLAGWPFACEFGSLQFIYTTGFALTSGVVYGGFLPSELTWPNNIFRLYKSSSSGVVEIDSSELQDSAIIQFSAYGVTS